MSFRIFDNLISTQETICPIVPVGQGQATTGFFEFKEGGSLQINLEIRATVTAKRECVVGQAKDAICAKFSGCKSTTKADGCDLCECTSSGIGTFGSGARWVRNATTITVNQGDFQNKRATFEYCAMGSNTLLLNDISSGPTNSTFIFTLERVTRSGVPVACQSRTVENCAKGSGCQVGQCTGGSTCATAKTEGSCLTFPNCLWNAKSCAGSPTPTCGEKDYDVVPGCSFVPVL